MVLVCIFGTKIIVNDNEKLTDYFIPFESATQKKLSKEESYSLLTTKFGLPKTIIIVSSTKEQRFKYVSENLIDLGVI